MRPPFFENKNELKRGGDMPRASNEKRAEAEKLFDDGIKLTDIAKKLGIPEGTVRSWKNRGKWGEASKKNNCNVAKDNKKETATLQKKKRGGQPGNRNAKGGKGGGAPKRNTNAEKHGAYSTFYFDAMSADERALMEDMPTGESALLYEQIAVYTVRERKLMHKIQEFKDNLSKGLYVKSIKKNKDSVYEEGTLKPESENTSTQTEHWVKGLVALESELTKVQRAKTKCIDSLIRLRAINDRYDDLLNGWKTKAEAEEKSEEGEDVLIYLPDNGRDNS